MNTIATPNANEIRLSRIKTISRVAMLLPVGFLAYTIWFLFRAWVLHGTPMLFDKVNASSARASDHYPLFLFASVFELASPLILCVWYWKLAQLFHFFAGGFILTVRTVRCVRLLGVLCMLNGVLVSAKHCLLQEWTQRMEFFSFSLGWGLDFGPLLAGTIIVLVALIMDEGRKMQEEQELTI